jgi:tyrosine-protein kinase Etk/Wzc
MSENATVNSSEEEEVSLIDLLQTIVDNLRLLVVWPLAVGCSALAISFAIKPTFTAELTFVVPQQQQGMAAGMLASLGALGGLAGAAAGLKNPADQYVAFLKSTSIENALIDRFKLMERYDAEFKQDARKTLENNIKISAGKDGLIKVEASDEDPQFAAQLANAHVDELSKLLGRLSLTEAQQRRQFFENQIEQTKVNLTKAELALRETGVASSVLKSDPVTAVAVVAGLQAQITAQEVKLGALRGFLAETAPEIKQGLTELSNLRSLLAKQSKQVKEPTSGQADYVAAFREFKYQETLFELFAKQFEMAKIDEAREGTAIQVVDPALPPERKSKPKKALIAILTTLATGFALLLFVFVRQSFRNASQDDELAQKLQRLKDSWHQAFKK